MQKTFRMSIFIVVTLIFGAVFYGCGKKEQTQLQNVKIMLSWTPGAEHAFLYYGKDRGLFRQVGIDLEIVPSKGSSVVAQALAAGVCDYGFVSGDVLVLSRSKNIPIKAIAVLYHESPVVVYSKTEKHISNPLDLVGKKLGILSQSTARIQVDLMLRHENVPMENVTIVPNLGSPIEILEDLVDAQMHFTNWAPAQLSVEHPEIKLEEIFVKDHGVKVYSSTLATRIDRIESKDGQDLTFRFVNAALQSLILTNQYQDSAMASLIAANPQLNPAVQSESLRRTMEMIFDAKTSELGVAYIESSGWKDMLETLTEGGLIVEREQMDVSEYFDTRFQERFHETHHQ